jgi:hypothetical protein
VAGVDLPKNKNQNRIYQKLDHRSFEIVWSAEKKRKKKNQLATLAKKQRRNAKNEVVAI